MIYRRTTPFGITCDKCGKLIVDLDEDVLLYKDKKFCECCADGMAVEGIVRYRIDGKSVDVKQTLIASLEECIESEEEPHGL